MATTGVRDLIEVITQIMNLPRMNRQSTVTRGIIDAMTYP
jgi:hypothetical protein